MPDWLLLLIVLSGCFIAIPAILLGLFAVGHRMALGQIADRADREDRA